MVDAERILIVAPAWVGDMVMAHCLVQVLAETRPHAELHVLAPPATAPLATRMAEIQSVRTFDVAHGELGFGKREHEGRALRAIGFDQAIVLPNSFKSAWVPFRARIPRRTGWHGEARFGVLNDRRRLDRARLPLMIEQFMALGLAPGAPLPDPYPLPRLEVDQDNRARLLRELGLQDEPHPVILCPGAEFGPAKRWPPEHYAAVARRLAGDGRAVWLLGSPKDREPCDAIAAQAPGVANLAGRTRLIDAVDLLSLADAVVCNDSGLMHVAGAVGARVIAVFGSTSPAFTPPLGPGAEVLRLGLDCSPCFARECPLGHLRCLVDLRPERVLAGL
ncbi:MAG: lipopolysaccharide heptosyltransferase II [Pseudomonadales bacterium]|nr:lipopolysaccharide heptosyltransferase II [Pseudomonadales bacterium]